MFIRQDKDGEYYICRKTHAGKRNSHGKGTERDWWLIKIIRGRKQAGIQFKSNSHIYLPQSFLGKRIRFKLEVI